MKLRDLRPYTRDAIARTHGAVEDRDRRAPTWDGRTLHIGRLREESHVLHEVAHWLVSKEPHRALPNYGLGRDPDGGPETETHHAADLREGRVSVPLARELARLAADSPGRFSELVAAGLSHQEELASVVTLLLMRRAGIAWAHEMRRVFGKLARADEGIDRFWRMVGELVVRGVDLEDPLRPFEQRARGAA